MNALANLNPTTTMTSNELVILINTIRKQENPQAAELAHYDFLKKVVKVLGFNAGNFSGVYTDAKGEQRPCYNLPKREASLMVMSESYKVQAAVYDKLTELESQQDKHSIPKTFAEALRLAADRQEQLENAQKQIEADRPKVEFANIITEDSNTRCLRVWIKAMKHENNLTAGERQVFKFLVEHKYIYRHGNGYLPYARYEAGALNYFTVVIDDINGKPRRQLKITGKGVVALTAKVVKAFGKQNGLVDMAGAA